MQVKASLPLRDTTQVCMQSEKYGVNAAQIRVGMKSIALKYYLHLIP